MKQQLILFILLFCNFCFSQSAKSKISLDEAIDLGLKNNLEIQKADKELQKAYKEKWKTISIGLPQINSSISYQNFLELPTSIVPAEFFGGKSGEFAEINFGTEQIANASISLKQLLFDGTYIVGLQGIKLYLEVAENLNEKTKQKIKSSIITAYTNVLLAKENVKILSKNLEILSKNIEETHQLFINGFEEEESVEQLRLTISNIISQLNYAKKLENISKQMLNFVLGFDLNIEIELTENLESLTLKSLSTNSLTTNIDLKNNLDIKLAENVVFEKKLFYRLEKAKALPAISAFISGAYTGNSNSFTFTEKNQKWFRSSQFGLKFDIPIFSSLGRSASSQKAKITLDQAKINLNETQKKIDLNYKKIKTEYILSTENYLRAKENLSLAERIEEKNRIKFFEGVSKSFELRQAQLQLYSAQSSFLKSMNEVISKKSELETIINRPK
ncbi:MAG: TolC family protein [Flavobacteriaceae bacterium]|nr:TolC family protein [Flavobacteriaceae bacterium]